MAIFPISSPNPSGQDAIPGRRDVLLDFLLLCLRPPCHRRRPLRRSAGPHEGLQEALTAEGDEAQEPWELGKNGVMDNFFQFTLW